MKNRLQQRGYKYFMYLFAYCLLSLLIASTTEIATAANTYNWVKHRGSAASLAVTPKGEAWVVGRRYGSLNYLPVTNHVSSSTWKSTSGNFIRVKATVDGTIWGITQKQTLYRLKAGIWIPFLSDIWDVATSVSGRIWLITADGKIKLYGEKDSFQPDPGFGTAIYIVADDSGLPWVGFLNGSVAHYNGNRWQKVTLPQSGLLDLSIAMNGSVFGVNGKGKLVKKNKDNQWSLVTQEPLPPAKRIAVTASGLLWFLSVNNNIYSQKPGKGKSQISPSVSAQFVQWYPLNKVASQLAAGGDAYFKSMNKIWKRSKGNHWVQIDGVYRSIKAGGKGILWAIDSSNHLSKWENGIWHRQNTSTSIYDVNSANQVWGWINGNYIARWDKSPYNAGTWSHRISVPFKIKSFVIGVHNDLWIIKKDDASVWHEINYKWNKVPGAAAKSIAIKSKGTVYITTAVNDEIYLLDQSTLKWKPVTGRAKDIAVDAADNLWAISSDDKLMTTADLTQDSTGNNGSGTTQVASVVWPLPSLTGPLSYQLTRGNFQVHDIAIGASGHIFAVGSGGLYCFNNSTKQFFLATIGNNKERVAVSPDGKPWVLGDNGSITFFDGSKTWRTAPGFARDISIAPDGKVWVIMTDGKTYRYSETSKTFILQPVVVSDKVFEGIKIAAASGGVTWIVTNNHELMRCKSGACHVALTAATDVDVAPDNLAFALDLNGNVQRYNEKTKAFEKQNGQGRDIAVGPQGLPWLVQNDGTVKYAGLIYPNSKRINTQNCAAPFSQSAIPSISSNELMAVDDAASLLPGASLDLLQNDKIMGRVATTNDVTVTLSAEGSGLTLKKNNYAFDVVVPSTATVGSHLLASYQICPVKYIGSCDTAQINIKVIDTAVVVPQVPATPTGVTAVAGNGQAVVSFSPPTSTGTSAITAYTVVSSPGGITVNSATSPVTITGLSNGTNYTFSVSATNAAGTGSTTTSNSVTPGTPNAPTNVTATYNASFGGFVRVTFTPSTSNGGSSIFKYTATSNPEGFTASDFATHLDFKLADGVLTPGVTYTFTVHATNANGAGSESSASNSVSVPP